MVFPVKLGYDALKFVIDEPAITEVWNYRNGSSHSPVGIVCFPAARHAYNKLSDLIRKIDADGYMNPEDPRTARYLADICKGNHAEL